MASWSLWPWIVGFVLLVLVLELAESDPQINLLQVGCSTHNISEDFFSYINETFSDLRKSLLDDKRHFAISSLTRVQCRNYLSTDDCVKCFDTAAMQIQICSIAAGGRVVYDGCSLRYEIRQFADQATMPGNFQKCGNQTVQDTVTFNSTVGSLVKDLELATPIISDHDAAIRTELTGGGNIYGVAQCAETIGENGCQICLKVASENIQGCFPNTDARASDSGCFLRYSTTPFFADDQTIDIRPFLKLGKQGSSSKRKVVIGVAAGCVGLLLVAVMLFLWYQVTETNKASRAGNILDATMLQGPLRYSYKDLKNATENFDEENKLGEGGFGKVYTRYF